MGAGTTGVVALALGCRFVGIDKEDTCENVFRVLLRKARTKRTTKTNESVWGWSKVLESFASTD
jgi:DNA modification methylase